ncbi:MAG: glycosyltransferase [Acidobacteriota bacterium]
MPFSPIAVAELEVGHGPILAINGLGLRQKVQILLRLDGCPLGYVDVSVTSGRCEAAAIVHEARAHHLDRARRRRVASRLASRMAAPDSPGELSLTVAVCTRNRTDDLAVCLASLATLDRPVDVLVVDNAPSDDRTARFLSQAAPPARYVVEPRLGLSWARRRAIAESRTDLLAFVDDDVRVDRGWASAIAALFAAGSNVQAVLGLVAPMELETEPQARFERHGGFGRGFDRRWLQRTQSADPRLVNTGTIGTGANMAFRRDVFDRLGLFDVALGAGTAAQGGEDLEMVFRVLASGGAVVYEPCALVWHRHRQDAGALRSQIGSWGSGMFAHLTASWLTWRDQRRAIATLGMQLLGLYYPRRILQALFDPDVKVGLAWAELVGALSGPSRYLKGRRRSADARTGIGRTELTQTDRRPSAPTVVSLDIARDIPARIPCAADTLELHVADGPRTLGIVRIPAGGCDVPASRVIDAIVAQFDLALLDPDGAVRAEIDACLPPELDPPRRNG